MAGHTLVGRTYSHVRSALSRDRTTAPKAQIRLIGHFARFMLSNRSIQAVEPLNSGNRRSTLPRPTPPNQQSYRLCARARRYARGVRAAFPQTPAAVGAQRPQGRAHARHSSRVWMLWMQSAGKREPEPTVAPDPRSGGARGKRQEKKENRRRPHAAPPLPSCIRPRHTVAPTPVATRARQRTP